MLVSNSTCKYFPIDLVSQNEIILRSIFCVDAYAVKEQMAGQMN